MSDIKTLVSVKELDWTKHPTADLWRADTIVGLYQVASIVSPATWTLDGLIGASANGTADGEVSAKAACQADYESRVLSSLSPSREAGEAGHHKVTDEMVYAAAKAHTPQFDNMDKTIKTYALDQMRAALEAALINVPASSSEVSPVNETERETEAAANIVDVMMGDDKSWRGRLDDSTFLESADWHMALTYARAALGRKP